MFHILPVNGALGAVLNVMICSTEFASDGKVE